MDSLAQTMNQRRALTVRLVLLLGLVMACSQPRVVAKPSPLRVAVLESQASDVFYMPESKPQSVIPPKLTTSLHSGDGIDVSAKGRALLQFNNTLRAQVFRQSKLNLQAVPNPTADAFIYLASGSMYLDMESQLSRVAQISTDGAKITVTGTRLWVHYDASRQITWVAVQEGAVKVSAVGVTVTVTANFQTWVKNGLPPQPPVPATRPLANTELFPSIEDLTNGVIADSAVLGNAQCTTIGQADLIIDSAGGPSAMILSANTYFEAEARSPNSTFIFGQGGWVAASALRCTYDVRTLSEKVRDSPIPPTSPPPIAFGVSAVSVSGNPRASAVCPTTFEFVGLISANGAANVSYQWETSDGSVLSAASLAFTEAGTQEVRVSWPRFESGSGWVRLRILQPNAMVSGEAAFSLSCTPVVQPPQPPAFAVTQARSSAKRLASTICPLTLDFVGEISANSAGTVVYQWEWNDGSILSQEQAVFTEAGAQVVYASLPINTSLSGGLRLHILQPNDLYSNAANFNVNCAPPLPIFQVTSVVAEVNPPSSNICPETFVFGASIAANGPGVVRYQWESSTESNSRPAQIIFDKAGTKTVFIKWPLSKSYSGWQQLRILDPNSLVSNLAQFVLACPVSDTEGPAAPIINAPTNAVEFDCGSNVALSWEAPSDASGIKNYQVQLQTKQATKSRIYFPWIDAGINNPITDNTVNLGKGLECSHAYQWRVVAVDGAGNQGKESEWAAFSVGASSTGVE